MERQVLEVGGTMKAQIPAWLVLKQGFATQEIVGKVVRQTDKAILLETLYGRTWLPLSQLTDIEVNVEYDPNGYPLPTGYIEPQVGYLVEVDWLGRYTEGRIAAITEKAFLVEDAGRQVWIPFSVADFRVKAIV